MKEKNPGRPVVSVRGDEGQTSSSTSAAAVRDASCSLWTSLTSQRSRAAAHQEASESRRTRRKNKDLLISDLQISDLLISDLLIQTLVPHLDLGAGAAFRAQETGRTLQLSENLQEEEEQEEEQEEEGQEEEEQEEEGHEEEEEEEEEGQEEEEQEEEGQEEEGQEEEEQEEQEEEGQEEEQEEEEQEEEGQEEEEQEEEGHEEEEGQEEEELNLREKLFDEKRAEEEEDVIVPGGSRLVSGGSAASRQSLVTTPEQLLEFNAPWSILLFLSDLDQVFSWFLWGVPPRGSEGLGLKQESRVRPVHTRSSDETQTCERRNFGST
ncbi:unnamed protein product [Pleuronectes platessa]|uniref:Uncharacterized protein n=1 Tax=Pleuronectes platessa TaxID=8262 RepID=A0A9N7Z4Z5_PLEPL|nr:unnamed protein product [Pleuronectes platessa]